MDIQNANKEQTPKELGADGKPKKKRGRPLKGTNNNSVNNSANNSTNNSPQVSRSNSPIIVSPNRFQALATNEDQPNGETWTCQICGKDFSDPNDKLLECQRCKEHYCIGCLDKSVEEYNLLTNSDLMWFCASGCREKVEKNIITDLKIEETCKKMTMKFEERLNHIENKLAEKCSKEEVIAVVREEMDKKSSTDKATEPSPEKENRAEAGVQDVLNEITERKNREANIVIYGLEESESTSRDERAEYDTKNVVEIADACEVKINQDDIDKVMRLGKYDKEKKTKRPLLVKLKTVETKSKIFKGIKKLNENEELKSINIANDLTKTERENEKKLYEQAKEMKKTVSGDYTFRVRGPPWARKIVKVRVAEEAE